jgi:F-type H+-transporting ATPase subunit b
MIRRLAAGWTIAAALALPIVPCAAAEPVDVEAHGQAVEAPGGEHGREHQLIEFDANTAVWVLIIFVLLLAILYPTAWKSVLAGLKAREERIRKDIADAEAARAKAEATLREYNAQLKTAEDKVRQMIADATAQGERVATDIRMRSQKEAEEAKQRATAEIEEAKKQALREIYQQAAELSTSIASKILRRSINASDQENLVRESIAQLETIK